MVLEDTDGDDKADTRELILHGFDSADSHHACHAFVWDPGMALYFQEGTFLHTQIETPYGPVRSHNAAVYRFEPRTWKLDNYVSLRLRQSVGPLLRSLGPKFRRRRLGRSELLRHGVLRRRRLSRQTRTATCSSSSRKQWRPTAGCELVSSRNFPDDVQGNYLAEQLIGFQGTLQLQAARRRFRLRRRSDRAAAALADSNSARSTWNSAPTARSTSSTGSIR